MLSRFVFQEARWSVEPSAEVRREADLIVELRSMTLYTEYA